MRSDSGSLAQWLADYADMLELMERVMMAVGRVEDEAQCHQAAREVRAYICAMRTC